jgi:hypothetical protein
MTFLRTLQVKLSSCSRNLQNNVFPCLIQAGLRAGYPERAVGGVSSRFRRQTIQSGRCHVKLWYTVDLS